MEEEEIVEAGVVQMPAPETADAVKPSQKRRKKKKKKKRTGPPLRWDQKLNLKVDQFVEFMAGLDAADKRARDKEKMAIKVRKKTQQISRVLVNLKNDLQTSREAGEKKAGRYSRVLDTMLTKTVACLEGHVLTLAETWQDKIKREAEELVRARKMANESKDEIKRALYAIEKSRMSKTTAAATAGGRRGAPKGDASGSGGGLAAGKGGRKFRTGARRAGRIVTEEPKASWNIFGNNFDRFHRERRAGCGELPIVLDKPAPPVVGEVDLFRPTGGSGISTRSTVLESALSLIERRRGGRRVVTADAALDE